MEVAKLIRKVSQVVSCRTCRFYVGRRVDEGWPNYRDGSCIRRAPGVVGYSYSSQDPYTRGEIRGGSSTCFPSVAPDLKCGEHKFVRLSQVVAYAHHVREQRKSWAEHVAKRQTERNQ